jgi:hypothetical protein
MWDPRRLTNVWASTACYRDSFFTASFNILFEVLYVERRAVWRWMVWVADNYLHAAESLRSRRLLTYSRTTQHFMEAEDSLPRSQDPSTEPYPEPDQSSP